MKSTSCEINFPNNPSGVFHSGQLLSGVVALKFTKPKTVKGIYVKIIGRAYCKWTSGGGDAARSNVGEEFYLDEKSFLVGDDRGFEVCLTPRDYNYAFSCMLPASLPTSVEGKIGYNRYKVVVHIERHTFALSHQKFKTHFTVIKPFNLNDEIDLKYPLVKECRKHYCICCCLFNQFVDVSATIPVSGYVPGQTIELSLKINNRTGQNFQNFIVQIMKVIQFHTYPNSSNTKIERTVVKSATCNGCSSYRSGTYNLRIAVPPLPPTDESTCNMVKVSYQLRVLGGIFCSTDDALLTFPIKIGTFPILVNDPASLWNRVNLVLQRQQAENLLFRSSTTSASYTNANSIDPPTYEEAISDYPDIISGDVFRPSYPVFRRTPSYTTSSNI